MPSTSGIEQATTTPARRPRLKKLTASTIAIASHNALVKPPTASSTTTGWSATRCASMPIGKWAMICSIVRHGLAEDEVVAALSHRDCEADRRLPVKSEHRLRRIGIPFFYCRNIGETKEFAVRKKID